MADSITLAHEHLTAKLTELRRRESQVRTAVAPLRYLANPWLYLGLAAVVGYRLGRPSRTAAPVVRAPPAAAGGETITRAIVRAGLVAAAQVLVHGALADRFTSPSRT